MILMLEIQDASCKSYLVYGRVSTCSIFIFAAHKKAVNIFQMPNITILSSYLYSLKSFDIT